MRLVIFFALNFLVSLYICAQNKKPSYYYDENEFKISEKVFETKLDNDKRKFTYLVLNFENDTCVFSLLKRRKNYGKLKSFQIDTLKTSLSENRSDLNVQYILIQYHPGADKCNNGSALVTWDKIKALKKNFFKQLNNKFGFKNFWIHKNDPTVSYSKVPFAVWQEDKNQVVEKLFFKYHYPCHSFVIIDTKSGNYISYFGEYGSKNFIDFTNELIGKF